MKAAIRDPDPVVFLENELLYGTAFDVDDAVMESDFVLPIGKAKIQRAGTDISLVAHSIGVGFAMDAADILAKEGISCEVRRLDCLDYVEIHSAFSPGCQPPFHPPSGHGHSERVCEEDRPRNHCGGRLAPARGGR